jgi:hypothetical protein
VLTVVIVRAGRNLVTLTVRTVPREDLAREAERTVRSLTVKASQMRQP